MSRLPVLQRSVNLVVVVHPYETDGDLITTMTTSTATAIHSHYYDYGYSDWSCIECQTSTDYCTEGAVKLGNESGCLMANRWPAGLPGNHPAHNNNNLVAMVGA